MGIPMKALLLAGVAALALTGCDRIRNVGEAGSFMDEGGFGDPTMNNVLVMTGQRSYVEELSTRFAQEVPTTINFAFNSAALDSQARAVLRQQARWILQFPEVRFSVYGHTDLVGTDAYNLSLGRRRAQAAVTYLVSQGISRSRLEALVTLGETQPPRRNAGPRTAQSPDGDGSQRIRAERPSGAGRALRRYRLSRLCRAAHRGRRLIALPTVPPRLNTQ